MTKLHTVESLISEVLSELDAAGEAYRVLSPTESERATGWLNQFPEARVGHIDWSRVSGSICRSWNDWGILTASFADLCETQALDDVVVIVIWANALSPCIEASLSVVRRHALTVFQNDPDVWIVCRQAGWCIEVWHEGTLCIGRHPKGEAEVGGIGNPPGTI